MNREFYDFKIPQETFIQNNLGKNIQISNDTDSITIVEINNEILTIFPGEIIYLVLQEEVQFKVYSYSNFEQGETYYTRSNSNMISLKRDAGDRIIPVYFFTRF